MSLKLLELERRNWTHIETGRSTLFSYENYSSTGRAGGAARPSTNLGRPHISETITARNVEILHTITQDQVLFSI